MPGRVPAQCGRRPTLATFLVRSALGAGMFVTADSETAVLVTGMVLSFFDLGAWGALHAVTPEVYPTPLRGTGAAAASLVPEERGRARREAVHPRPASTRSTAEC